MTSSPLVSLDDPKNRVSNRNLGRLLSYLKKPVITAVIIALLDPIVLWLGLGSVPRTTLVLVLFLEGSVGLIAGAAIALSSTPSISKAGEIVFGCAAWSREAEKNADGIAVKWMIASTLIILAGFAVSAV